MIEWLSAHSLNTGALVKHKSQHAVQRVQQVSDDNQTSNCHKTSTAVLRTREVCGLYLFSLTASFAKRPMRASNRHRCSEVLTCGEEMLSVCCSTASLKVERESLARRYSSPSRLQKCRCFRVLPAEDACWPDPVLFCQFNWPSISADLSYLGYYNPARKLACGMLLA